MVKLTVKRYAEQLRSLSEFMTLYVPVNPSLQNITSQYFPVFLRAKHLQLLSFPIPADMLDCRFQFVYINGLQQIVLYTKRNSHLHIFKLLISAKHYKLCSRMHFLYFFYKFKPVHSWHHNVCNEQVYRFFLQLLQRLLTIVCRTNNFQVILAPL
ncbi:hypothetical protein D3C77_507790 [compost metagenome]